MDGLTALDAAGIAARVHDGLTSAVDVARAHLDRIAALDGDLGAFATLDPHRVLAQAECVDARADRFALPLAGVPVAVEDCVDVAGHPTRHGSAATSDHGRWTSPASTAAAISTATSIWMGSVSWNSSSSSRW